MISAVLTGKNVTRTLVLGALAAFGSLTAPAATVVSTTRTAQQGAYGVSWHTNTKFLDGASEMSVIVWTKNCTAVNMLRLVEQGGQFHIRCDNTSQKVLFVVAPVDAPSGTVQAEANASILTRATLNDGSWHCISATFKYDSVDSSKSFLRIYCDGVQAGELIGSTITGPLASATEGFTIGGQWAGTYANWRIAGRFTEVSLWNRALTADEVASLAHRRPWCGETGLIGYWLPADAKNYKNHAKNGTSATLSESKSNYTLEWVDDPDFPCGNEYCVASKEWSAEHPAYDPTGKGYRNWDEPALIGQVQDILDASPAAPTIVFGEGTFEPAAEILVSRNDAVRMRRSAESATVVLDGQNVRRLLKIDPPKVDNATSKDVDIEIDGLTFVNGSVSSESGGAVYMGSGCASSSSETATKRCRLVNCAFKDNESSGSNGGALYIASGYVSNCVFTANSAARNGGAICCDGWASYDNSTGTLTYEYGIPAIYDCKFTSNTACRGGAVADSNDGASGWLSFVVRGCVFDSNTTSGTVFSKRRGGHVALAKASVLADSVFTGESSADYGACVNWQQTGVLISRCTFANAVADSGYGFLHTGGTSSTIDRCVFSNLTTKIDVVFAESAGDLVVQNCLFAKNSLPNGNSIVAGHNTTSVRMENCTLADNTKTLTSYPFRNNSGSAKYISVNSICADRSAVINGSTLVVSNSCVIAPAPGGALDSGVVIGAPRFVDAEHGDYTLAGGKCRDKGLVLPWMDSASVDLAGLPRLVNGSGVAYAPDALPDLGCFEIQTAKPGVVLVVR